MKPIILTDFDGTITAEDTLVKLLNTFAPKSWHKIEKLVKSGHMGSRVALRKEFSLFYITKKRYISFIKRHVTIDPFFKAFLRFVRARHIPFVILSGGFKLNVQTVLGKYRIRGVPYYANVLRFKRNQFEVEYPYPGNGCHQCGNCKKRHLLRFKNNGYFIIYIGDSTTDRCPVKEADLVFAKWELAEYCAQKKIPYVAYSSFRDIRDHLIATLPL
jgi:2,3-diketo-5-methylthio-1-phosphopentane phosphatase